MNNNNKTCHIFIIGVGVIGKELINQISSQEKHLKEKYKMTLKICGLANSKKMIFSKKGISKSNWNSILENSKTPMQMDAFIKGMDKNKIDSLVDHYIFVDNTANSEIAKFYKEILKRNISVVTPNKIANSSSQKEYNSLKKIAFERGVHYLYETNVGAGLPIINTLNNLVNSGDKIIKIEGVFSGSVSYIFNNYNGKKKFRDVVFDAKKKGFTEPDPREDLSGFDIARKILILSREIGLEKEFKDVKIQSILPKNCLNASSVDEFSQLLSKEEKFFLEKYKKAKSKNGKLCYLATITNNSLSVELKVVNQTNPFFHLQGSENMISFTTNRYNATPLLVRGPGAGASVTAAGVFSDIISIVNS